MFNLKNNFERIVILPLKNVEYSITVSSKCSCSTLVNLCMELSHKKSLGKEKDTSFFSFIYIYFHLSLVML